MGVQEGTAQPITVLHGMTALATSAAICHAAHQLAVAAGSASASIPIATAITVTLATLVPNVLQPLTSSAEGLAAILMQVSSSRCALLANVKRSKLTSAMRSVQSCSLPCVLGLASVLIAQD